MNIFLFDPLDLENQAKCHPDKLVVKMQLEICQMLNNHLPESIRFYKTTHLKHPCNVWLGENPTNLSYGVKYLLSLIREYESRYQKISNYRIHIPLLQSHIKVTEELPKEFPVAINNEILYTFLKAQHINEYEYQLLLATKRASCFLSRYLYRNYLLGYKCHYSEWRYCEPPEFWRNGDLSDHNGRFCRLITKRTLSNGR